MLEKVSQRDMMRGREKDKKKNNIKSIQSTQTMFLCQDLWAKLGEIQENAGEKNVISLKTIISRKAEDKPWKFSDV